MVKTDPTVITPPEHVCRVLEMANDIYLPKCFD